MARAKLWIDGREVSVALSGGCVSPAGAGSSAQAEMRPTGRGAQQSIGRHVKSQASMVEVCRGAALFQVLHRQQAKLKKAHHNLKFLTDKVSESKNTAPSGTLSGSTPLCTAFDRDSVAHILLLDLVELCVQRHADQFVIARGWRSRPGGHAGQLVTQKNQGSLRFVRRSADSCYCLSLEIELRSTTNVALTCYRSKWC